MKIQVRAFWSSDQSLNFLLWTLGITMFLVFPLSVQLGAPEWERGIGAAFFTLIVVSGVTAVWSRREVRLLAVLILAVPLILLWLEVVHRSAAFTALNSLLRLLMVAVFATVLMARVLAPGRVTKARLKGAIAVYLLIGVLFAEVYRTLCIVFPGAISVHATNDLSMKFGAELLYFSLSTLTTAGYGDIVPIHPFARAIANLEAISGQMYIVLLIGRLLTLHMSQTDEEMEERVEERVEQREEDLDSGIRTTEPRRPIQKG